MRIKILEAWARGVPVVATPAALAGLEVEQGREALVAREPRDFAAAIRRLGQEPELAASLVAAGRQALKKRHDPPEIARRLLASTKPPRNSPPPRLSELAHERDLRLQPIPHPLFDDFLDMGDECPYVGRRGAAGVDEDVCVAAGDHGAADPHPLETALVDQPAGADPLDLLEDGTGARFGIQRRVALPPPFQILGGDAAQPARDRPG